MPSLNSRQLLVASIILATLTGCASHVFVRSPAEGVGNITTPYTLEAQKNEGYGCSYQNNTFKAIMDSGQSSELDITNSFTRPTNTNIWTAANYNLPTGLHTLYVEGRFRGTICTGTFDSGQREFMVTTGPLPDLIVGSAQVVPASPSTADHTTIDIVVTNQGGTPSTTTTADILQNGVVMDTINIAALGQSESTSVSKNITFSTPGTYNIVVSIDPTNAVTESNESNNNRAQTVVVRDCSGSDRTLVMEAARERIARGDVSADLDGDCRDEYTRVFDGAGIETREEIDINGDGTPEIVWDKIGVTKTYRVDADQNGIPELELAATPNSSNPDIVNYIRTWDSSSDGIPDRRIVYTIDQAQPTYVVRHESDSDQNGSWTLDLTTTAQTQQESFYDVVTSGPDACNSTQQSAIENAFYDAWNEGSQCLYGMDARLGMTFLRNMGRHTFEFSCKANFSPTACARAVDATKIDSFFFIPDRLRIYLDPTRAFDGSCGSLTEVIFHELLHFAAGHHHPYSNPGQDPGDRVYNCVKTCFGSGDSISCAACLDKKNGASECAAYPQVACPTNKPAHCSCDNKIYPNEVICAVDCPSGLACPYGVCTVVDGPCQ